MQLFNSSQVLYLFFIVSKIIDFDDLNKINCTLIKIHDTASDGYLIAYF